MAALPYFDEIVPSNVDVLLITHFHLDHTVSLPYFLEKTIFRGGCVFMIYATKAIYKLLLSDFVKVSKVSVEDMLYDEHDINRSMDKIEDIFIARTNEKHLEVAASYIEFPGDKPAQMEELGLQPLDQNESRKDGSHSLKLKSRDYQQNQSVPPVPRQENCINGHVKMDKKLIDLNTRPLRLNGSASTNQVIVSH
ncbi:hypothetical protein RJT34_12869 [Clitoria ternatea]|uniref:Metallo-beta-lactamase domain-containing protein n=1 Tax=Clitoria ternatea TaxID=43366 RepID=A0AAN9JMV9_CLITE